MEIRLYSQRQDSFILIGMDKWFGYGVLIALLCGIGYGVHLIANYVSIEAELRHKAKRIAQPVVRDDDVVQFGYVKELTSKLNVSERRSNLVWFVDVPGEKIPYTCVYDYGFQDFRRGDDIRIIHSKDLSEGDYGYMIDLSDQRQGKAALVWMFNEKQNDFEH